MDFLLTGIGIDKTELTRCLVTVGNNETMPLLPQFLLGEFMKTSESWIIETNIYIYIWKTLSMCYGQFVHDTTTPTNRVNSVWL